MIGVAGVIKQRLDGQQQQRLDGQPGPLRRTLLHLRPPVKQLDLRRCATARSRAGETARALRGAVGGLGMATVWAMTMTRSVASAWCLESCC